MATPTYKPTEHTHTTHTTPPTPPTTRATPDDGSNAADKPWYERPGHAGAIPTEAETAANKRRPDTKDD
jgi:hypothetical protein